VLKGGSRRRSCLTRPWHWVTLHTLRCAC